MQSGKCNAFGCHKQCTTGCSVCNFHYCSTKCQQQDWSIHKLTCAARKCDRLRKLVNYQLTDAKNFPLIVPSCDYFDYPRPDNRIKSNGHLKALDGVDVCNQKCVICQVWIKNPGRGNHSFRFKVNNSEIVGYRCDDCGRKDIKLMPGSYMTLGETKLYLMCCIKQFKVCRDIRKLLCSYIKYDSRVYESRSESEQVLDRSSRIEHRPSTYVGYLN